MILHKIIEFSVSLFPPPGPLDLLNSITADRSLTVFYTCRPVTLVALPPAAVSVPNLDFKFLDIECSCCDTFIYCR